MSGRLTSGERKEIFNAGAERGVANGMPGSSASGGSLFANADLRNIGLASGQRQQQGFQDLLSMLQGYSGTVVPTTGQQIQSGQFQQDLGFRQNEANRSYGLQQNAQDLSAARFNEQYGPRYTGSSETYPGGQVRDNGGAWYTPRGEKASNASSLMFKYKR